MNIEQAVKIVTYLKDRIADVEDDITYAKQRIQEAAEQGKEDEYYSKKLTQHEADLDTLEEIYHHFTNGVVVLNKEG